MNFMIVLLISYLIGAIPFAYLITRLITGKDVRKHGSGNVGATNAARVMGFKYGILVAILDIAKGILAVIIARNLLTQGSPTYFLLISSLFVIIGHNWSVFLNFSGGKGVATTFGVIISLFPLVFLYFLIIWILLVIITRYVSLASIVSAGVVPFLVYFNKGNIYEIIFTLIFALLIIFRHSSNIKRLLNGEESRMNWPSGVKKGDL
ncbi:MAG: glycerol-3-phosphate 1-O-acyltransferase PlsY [Bacillota bacterium]